MRRLLLIVGETILAIFLIFVSTSCNADPMNSRELAVQQELRTINTAQANYHLRFGKYAGTLGQLGPPEVGAPGPAAADLISSSLASGDKDQYRFLMTLTPAGYTLTATPKVRNNSGRRSFYTDQTMVLRASVGRVDASSPEVK